jgi:hypothetical protein
LQKAREFFRCPEKRGFPLPANTLEGRKTNPSQESGPILDPAIRGRTRLWFVPEMGCFSIDRVPKLPKVEESAFSANHFLLKLIVPRAQPSALAHLSSLQT